MTTAALPEDRTPPAACRHAARLWAARVLAASLLAAGLGASPARGAEPPEREGLICTVARQSIGDDGLRLEVVFSNQTAEALSLPPGPHLVLYADAAASEPLEDTARIDRLQRTPLVVPAQGRVTGLYGADARGTETLRCNGTAPAAVGLYFYQFSRRPTFRCVLREVPLASWPMKRDCPRASPRASPVPAAAAATPR